MNPYFNRGDVVQLKSGGPQMTVLLRLGDDAIDAIWFDAEGHLQRSELQNDVVKQVDAPMPRVDVRMPVKLKEGGW